MPPLSDKLRKSLEAAIKNARREAEVGAKRALEALAVHHYEPHASMTLEDRALRNRLRARGRQLGDVRDRARGTQPVNRLAHEVAYEHWHRMLFARFLAENGLLIEPESGVAITMAECEELARDHGEDPQALAARFAQVELPQIFRSDDPVLEVGLAPETRQAMEILLDSLPVDVFTADDSLGWTYQYWQTEKKVEINKSGVKIGADELPAVTQLFTEHYMVLFLFHNTIGAWHAGKVLAANPTLGKTAQSEEELRQAVRLRSHGGYNFEHLRFVREPREDDQEDAPTGPWRPAAGTFEDWPKTAKELKVLDPCCGSGHFLVEGFELLVRLRMDEEGSAAQNAVSKVLGENLHGLEIDPRCTQIAAFNLAMAAWKLAGKPIELPPLHIACSGLAVGSTKNEWVTLAGDDDRLRAGMEHLHELFEQASELGSLIEPRTLEADLLVANFGQLQPLLTQALAQESHDVDGLERAVAAQGMARAAELLSTSYTLLATNVPFLTQSKFSVGLKAYIYEALTLAKENLSTAFLYRFIGEHPLAETVALVAPQSWWFLKRYRHLRKFLLDHRRLGFLARLGERAFVSQQAGGELVGLSVLDLRKCSERRISLIDASQGIDPQSKSEVLRGKEVTFALQERQIQNKEHALAFEEPSHESFISDYATALQGCVTGDSPQFFGKFWERSQQGQTWTFLQTTSALTRPYGGMTDVILWEEEEGRLAALAQHVRGLNHSAQNWRKGKPNWGRTGVVVSQMGAFPATLYCGDIYDHNCCAIVPFDEKDTPALWAFCSSREFSKAVRATNQNRKVEVGTFLNVGFEIDEWRQVAAEEYSEGLPEPYSEDPTQRLFHGHPAKSEAAAGLQVAVGRLLGYFWPVELDRETRLSAEACKWLARCDALKEYADEDGVVCLSAVRGERSAADRLRALLSVAFGPAWSATRERELLAAAGDGKKPAASLENWLRDEFFEEHCKLFHHRPFIWHIWDGNKNGFHCLVNAHKLTGPDGEGRRTLEAITYSYLGDWIERQRAEQREGNEGADGRLEAAHDLQGQLEMILEGEPPYDLFVRWKPLHEQAVGWKPDINDGVRLNIRPFMRAGLRRGGKKGAGILRWKPNIKVSKDRGTDLQSMRPREDFPWFWGCKGDGRQAERTDFRGGSDFDGNRWNDLHYRNAYKHAARERASEEKQHEQLSH